jgi:hypothetical protein
MPLEMIQGIVGVMLLMAGGVYLIRKRWPSAGPIADVGQPPKDAEPMVEPRLQDIGFATYELPLSDPEPDAAPKSESDRPPLSARRSAGSARLILSCGEQGRGYSRRAPYFSLLKR